MAHHTAATGDSSPTSSQQLTDYLNEGYSFLKACQLYRNKLRRNREGDSDTVRAHQHIEALKELLHLLQQPDDGIDTRLVEVWLPKSYTEKERRYRNYLLWHAFSTERDRREHACPALSERALLRALRAGRNEFECKHLLFNLLVSAGFPKKQACLLAKYLGNRISN